MTRALLGLAALLLASCGSGAPTYAGCEDDLDCAGVADRCHRLLFDLDDGTTADGNMCTHECITDSECNGGVCISLEGDPSMQFFCAARCGTSADCYADLACTSVDSMDLNVCLP